MALVLTPVRGALHCSCCRKQRDPAILESNSPPMKPDFPLQPWKREREREIHIRAHVLNSVIYNVWFYALHSDVKYTSALNDALKTCEEETQPPLSPTHTHTLCPFSSPATHGKQLTESDDLEKLKTTQLCIHISCVYVFSGANNSHTSNLIRVLYIKATANSAYAF